MTTKSLNLIGQSERFSTTRTYLRTFHSYHAIVRNGFCYVRYLIINHEICIELYKYFAEIYTIHAIYTFIG